MYLMNRLGGARRGATERAPAGTPEAQMTHAPAPKLPFPVADPNVSYNQAISRRTTLRPPRLTALTAAAGTYGSA